MGSTKNIDEVTIYLFEKYQEDDALRLAKTKMVSHIATSDPLPDSWQSLIDKVALFNGIKKLSNT